MNNYDEDEENPNQFMAVREIGALKEEEEEKNEHLNEEEAEAELKTESRNHLAPLYALPHNKSANISNNQKMDSSFGGPNLNNEGSKVFSTNLESASLKYEKPGSSVVGNERPQVESCSMGINNGMSITGTENLADNNKGSESINIEKDRSSMGVFDKNYKGESDSMGINYGPSKNASENVAGKYYKESEGFGIKQEENQGEEEIIAEKPLKNEENSEKNEEKYENLIIFEEKSERKIRVRNDSKQQLNQFMVFLRREFGELKEITNLEISISFAIDDAIFTEFSQCLKNEHFPSFTNLKVFKLEISKANLKEINIYELFSGFPLSLNTIEITVNSTQKINLLNKMCIFSRFLYLERLRVFINTIDHKESQYQLDFSFAKEKMAYLKEFGTIVYEENYKNIMNFLKNHDNLTDIELIFQTPKLVIGLLAEIAENNSKILKNLKVTVDGKEDFSHENLMDILGIFLEKDSIPFNDLLTLEIGISHYYPNFSDIKLKCLETDFAKNLPKIQLFLLNSSDLRQFFTAEALESKANQLQNEEFNKSLQLLLKSRTMGFYLAHEDFNMRDFSNILGINGEKQIIDKILDLDKLFEAQENGKAQENEKNSKTFKFSIENSEILSFYLKILGFFIRTSPKINELFLYFTLSTPEKEDLKIFQAYPDEPNLNVNFIVDKRTNFKGFDSILLPDIKFFKLFFKNCLKFAENFLQKLNNSPNVLPQIKSFSLSFEETNRDFHEKSTIILPFKCFPETLGHIFISSDGVDLSNRFSEEILILSNLVEFLDSEIARKNIKNLEILLNKTEIVSFYDYFKGFFHVLSEKPLEKLNYFRLAIPSMKLLDEDFQKRFQLLGMKSLKSLDLNLEDTGIGKMTMKALTDFIERNKDLENISLMLRNNNLIDISGFLKVLTKNNLPKLEVFKLYLHKTNLNGKVLSDLGESLGSFPENITEFKVDLEGNDLNERNRIFSRIAESLANKFKKLQKLQFHMNSCNIGKAEIVAFLEEALKIKTSKELFFSLSNNKGFWDNGWSGRELEALRRILLGNTNANKLRIELTGKKSWKEKNIDLMRELENVQTILKKDNKNFLLKF